MEQERRRQVDSYETTLKKFKNSGYFFGAILLLNAGMMYQQNHDFTESQKTINARQQLTNEQSGMALGELKTAVQELKAIEAGQDRRITMLENRQK